MASTLRQLADLISVSVDAIDARFSKNGLTFPSLNDPFNPVSPAEALLRSPDLVKHIMTAVSACSQLTATVNMPMSLLGDVGLSFQIPAALRATVVANVVEVLRDHPEGLHVKDIAEKGGRGIDPAKLARILRALATNYIFIETAPDTFKNNRLSSLLDTHKSVEAILANPEEKYVGFAAMLDHAGDEMFKGAAYLTETLLDPQVGHSDAQADTSIARAFGIQNKSVWEWYEEPGNEFRLRRFAAGAGGIARSNQAVILSGFKWDSLPPNSVIVDVGGGQGHNMLTICEKFPDSKLRFVVQDREGVMEQARKFWELNAPDAIKNGDVTFQSHNFFEPQPIQSDGPSVFFLSMILHDYGHALARKILKHLRDAATTGKTKLVIVDQVVPYACPSPAIPPYEIPIQGADNVQPQEVPTPLVPNLGKANSIAYIGDLCMLVGLNGEARTLAGYIKLLEASGWRIEEVYPGGVGGLHSQIVARTI
ncbi:O-methyltransferase [Marasmius fiardii PR-910]|nr:O-methyltransferase [Marasmius fiardii PR-910]